MKTATLKLALVACAALLQLAPVQAQDHGHLNIGAKSQTQDAKLTFDNGADFTTGSLYVKTLTFSTTGKYAKFYNGNITLTALHATDAFGEAVVGGPAPGALIQAEIVSVQGPPGGFFQFWETNSTTAPTVVIPSGTTRAGFRFDIGEAALGAGQPGGDPFGHIHGRRFSVSKPGLYAVGFRAFDVSVNGTAGGPIHTPSDVLTVYFQGDVNIAHVVPDVDHTHITFGALLGYNWQVQAKDSLSDPQWTPVGAPVPGNDKLVEIEDERAVGASRFYRVVGTP